MAEHEALLNGEVIDSYESDALGYTGARRAADFWLRKGLYRDNGELRANPQRMRDRLQSRTR